MRKATPEVAATPEAGEEGTPERGAGATPGGDTPWAAVATSVADISAAGISPPRAGISPVPRAGTIMPGLTSPAPRARRPFTRPRTDVSGAPARCTRPLATRAPEGSYPAGTARTPGAAATGMGGFWRAVFFNPGFALFCRV